jgi:hypothetical protein
VPVRSSLVSADSANWQERHGASLFVPGDIDPARGSEIEEAVWERMHFASHLRSERLGEVHRRRRLHRSESLAIVHLLVLYNLVTARATVALGGEATRTMSRVRRDGRPRRPRPDARA